jgi:hypothetical protein
MPLMARQVPKGARTSKKRQLRKSNCQSTYIYIYLQPVGLRVLQFFLLVYVKKNKKIPH